MQLTDLSKCRSVDHLKPTVYGHLDLGLTIAGRKEESNRNRQASS